MSVSQSLIRISTTLPSAFSVTSPCVPPCYLGQEKGTDYLRSTNMHTYTFQEKLFTFPHSLPCFSHWQINTGHSVCHSHTGLKMREGEREGEVGGITGCQSWPLKGKKHVKQRKRDAGCQKGRRNEERRGGKGGGGS